MNIKKSGKVEIRSATVIFIFYVLVESLIALSMLHSFQLKVFTIIYYK